jgi:hypothetical protein
MNSCDPGLVHDVPECFGRPAQGAPCPHYSHIRRVLGSLMVATMALGSSHLHAKVVDVVEFYNAARDHYFITSLPDEIDALDAGRTRGWTRTGLQFRAQDTLVNGTNKVCRYYIPPDSHFFSASAAECAKVHNLYADFIKESDAVMHVAMPHASTGECKSTDEPVYRLWNRRVDSNHRYVTSLALRNAMVAQGWVPEGYGPDAVAMCAPKTAAEPNPVTVSLPPPCKGNDSRVAVPGAPHGMYVWNPNAFALSFLQKDVIGKDPTLCGASLVIFWSSVETANGVYDWSSVIAAAKPFTDAGLTVNLLFSEATEGETNQVTPGWVTMPVSAGGAGAPSISCAGDPTMPVYFSPAYEAAWTAFIAAAVRQFSFANSPLAANVGYMRFATGGGAEALVPPDVNDGGPCQQAWAAAGYSYDVWNQHEANIIRAIGSQPTDKQLMVSLGQAPNGPNVYDVSNKAAAVAVPLKVGFSFENLGTSNIAAASATPGPCNPQATLANLHWCQAYTTYVGEVPFAMQPITATTNTNVVTMDIGNLLQYALDNSMQIFELYPEEWLSADSPTWPAFVAARQAKYQAALQAASMTLGATNGQ